MEVKPIIKFNKSSDELQFKINNLQNLLNNESEFKIITIWGLKGGGKSLFFNFLLRYLLKYGEDDWLGYDEPEQEMNGFPPWGSENSKNENISWISSKINFRNRSIFLIDLERISDDLGEIGENSLKNLILQMSTCIIVNFAQNHSQETFQNFEKIFESVCESQVPLILVERNSSDFRLVQIDTKSFLTRNQIENFLTKFQNISCFSIPYPGDEILLQDYNGSIGNLESKFLNYINFCIPLIAKFAHESTVTFSAKEILHKFEEISKNSKPRSNSFRNDQIIDSAIQNYVNNFEKILKSNEVSSMDDLEVSHKKLKDESLDIFMNSDPDGSVFKVIKKLENDLINTLEKKYQEICEIVESKRMEITLTNEKLMRKALEFFYESVQEICKKPYNSENKSIIEKELKTLVNHSLEMYSQEAKIFENSANIIVTDSKSKLEDEMSIQVSKILLEIDEKIAYDISTHCQFETEMGIKNYKFEMEKLMVNYFNEEKFQEIQSEIMCEILKNFKQNTNHLVCDDNYYLDEFESKLESFCEYFQERRHILKVQLKMKCSNILNESFSNYEIELENCVKMENLSIEQLEEFSNTKKLETCHDFEKAVPSNAKEFSASHMNDLIGKIDQKIKSTRGKLALKIKKENKLLEDGFQNFVKDSLKSYNDVKNSWKISLTNEDEINDAFLNFKNTLFGKLKEFYKTSTKRTVDQMKAFTSKFSKIIEDEFKNDLPLLLLEIKEIDIQFKDASIKIFDCYEEQWLKSFPDSDTFQPTQKLEKVHNEILKSIRKNIYEDLPFTQFHLDKLENLISKEFSLKLVKNSMKQVSQEPAIGIDLGTTYVCVSIYSGGNVVIIRNENGNNVTPSFVAYTSDGEFVGEAAKNEAPEDPENTVYESKRLIGRQFKDPFVQKNLKRWPFQVVDNFGRAFIKIPAKTEPIDPIDISVRLLSAAKLIAEAYLGQSVTKAVITVPANFNDAQRSATRDAGRMAHLDVIRIINEPTAAAVAYNWDQRKTNIPKKVLVYDFGGGTFDVSIVQILGGKLSVLAVGGDMELGGEDLDNNLVDYSIKKFKELKGIDLYEERDSNNLGRKKKYFNKIRRLKNMCEETKINLSTAPAANIIVDAFYQEIDLNLKITRDIFNELNKKYFEKTIEIIEKTLKSKNIEPKDIDDVILVGGSSQIPKVHKLLEAFFPFVKFSRKINPEEAVSFGAAIVAAQGEHYDKDLNDVTPFSIGVELVDGVFCPIIPKNTTIPVTKTEPFYKNSKKVCVVIYEGENEKAVLNRLLGNFELTFDRDNEEEITLTMRMDNEGILHVSAVSSSGEKNLSIVKKL